MLVSMLVKGGPVIYSNSSLSQLSAEETRLDASTALQAEQRHNSLWPSDTIWRQRSGSTLAQVMACWLTATSHYLNQR